jgi:site-specific recombinase XerD
MGAGQYVRNNGLSWDDTEELLGHQLRSTTEMYVTVDDLALIERLKAIEKPQQVVPVRAFA